MKVGGLYEYIYFDVDRELLDDKHYRQYSTIDISSSLASVMPNEVVVCLEEKFINYYDSFFGDSGYEPFMKVLTKDGLIGWVVLREAEWKLVGETK